MCAARSRCFWPITRASKPRRGVAGSAGDRQTVARGFCGGCSLMTKPNSARIRLAPTNNSPGVLARRCCVALLLSAAVLSPPLSAATAPPARAATAEAKPGYLIRAEKNYRQARQAVLALQDELKQLNQQKAREGQRALAKSGQWIEPAGLWRKTRATQKNLSYARIHEHHARTELNVTRNAARTKRVGGFPKGEFQPLGPFWWW